jgi:hypothetical protein
MTTPIQTLLVTKMGSEMYLVPNEPNWYTFLETLELLGEKGWWWTGGVHPHNPDVLIFQRKEPSSI